MRQGWFPDAISTDVARNPDGTPASVLLPMSQYLHLGLSLDQVIECVTATPAAMLNYPEKVGSLEPDSRPTWPFWIWSRGVSRSPTEGATMPRRAS